MFSKKRLAIGKNVNDKEIEKRMIVATDKNGSNKRILWHSNDKVYGTTLVSTAGMQIEGVYYNTGTYGGDICSTAIVANGSTPYGIVSADKPAIITFDFQSWMAKVAAGEYTLANATQDSFSPTVFNPLPTTKTFGAGFALIGDKALPNVSDLKSVTQDYCIGYNWSATHPLIKINSDGTWVANTTTGKLPEDNVIALIRIGEYVESAQNKISTNQWIGWHFHIGPLNPSKQSSNEGYWLNCYHGSGIKEGDEVSIGADNYRSYIIPPGGKSDRKRFIPTQEVWYEIYLTSDINELKAGYNATDTTINGREVLHIRPASQTHLDKWLVGDGVMQTYGDVNYTPDKIDYTFQVDAPGFTSKNKVTMTLNQANNMDTDIKTNISSYATDLVASSTQRSFGYYFEPTEKCVLEIEKDLPQTVFSKTNPINTVYYSGAKFITSPLKPPHEYNIYNTLNTLSTESQQVQANIYWTESMSVRHNEYMLDSYNGIKRYPLYVKYSPSEWSDSNCSDAYSCWYLHSDMYTYPEPEKQKYTTAELANTREIYYIQDGEKIPVVSNILGNDIYYLENPANRLDISTPWELYSDKHHGDIVCETVAQLYFDTKVNNGLCEENEKNNDMYGDYIDAWTNKSYGQYNGCGSIYQAWHFHYDSNNFRLYNETFNSNYPLSREVRSKTKITFENTDFSIEIDGDGYTTTKEVWDNGYFYIKDYYGKDILEVQGNIIKDRDGNILYTSDSIIHANQCKFDTTYEYSYYYRYKNDQPVYNNYRTMSGPTQVHILTSPYQVFESNDSFAYTSHFYYTNDEGKTVPTDLNYLDKIKDDTYQVYSMYPLNKCNPPLDKNTEYTCILNTGWGGFQSMVGLLMPDGDITPCWTAKEGKKYIMKVIANNSYTPYSFPFSYVMLTYKDTSKIAKTKDEIIKYMKDVAPYVIHINRRSYNNDNKAYVSIAMATQVAKEIWNFDKTTGKGTLKSTSNRTHVYEEKTIKPWSSPDITVANDKWYGGYSSQYDMFAALYDAVLMENELWLGSQDTRYVLGCVTGRLYCEEIDDDMNIYSPSYLSRYDDNYTSYININGNISKNTYSLSQLNSNGYVLGKDNINNDIIRPDFDKLKTLSKTQFKNNVLIYSKDLYTRNEQTSTDVNIGRCIDKVLDSNIAYTCTPAGNWVTNFDDLSLAYYGYLNSETGKIEYTLCSKNASHAWTYTTTKY